MVLSFSFFHPEFSSECLEKEPVIVRMWSYVYKTLSDVLEEVGVEHSLGGCLTTWAPQNAILVGHFRGGIFVEVRPMRFRHHRCQGFLTSIFRAGRRVSQRLFGAPKGFHPTGRTRPVNR